MTRAMTAASSRGPGQSMRSIPFSAPSINSVLTRRSRVSGSQSRKFWVSFSRNSPPMANTRIAAPTITMLQGRAAVKSAMAVSSRSNPCQ